MKAIILSEWMGSAKVTIANKQSLFYTKHPVNLDPPFDVYLFCRPSKKKDEFGLPTELLVLDQTNDTVNIVDYFDYKANEYSKLLSNRVYAKGTCISTYPTPFNCSVLVVENIKVLSAPRKIKDFKKPCIMKDKKDCSICRKCIKTYYMEKGQTKFAHGYCENNIKQAPSEWCYIEIED